MSREIRIGNTAIGGENHIVIQSMLNAHHLDVEGNVEQAKKLEAAGCEIIRVSIPNSEALKLIPAIKTLSRYLLLRTSTLTTRWQYSPLNTARIR